MNETQWRFELESLKMSEDERFDELKEILDAFRKGLISVLGLDLMPIREEEEGLLRRAKADDFVPLAVVVGRDEWLKDLGDKMEELFAQEEAQKQLESPPPGMISSLEELEAYERMQEEDGDIQFPDDPEEMRKFLIWNSPRSKYVRENIILKEEPEAAPVPEVVEEKAPRDRRIIIEKKQNG